MSRNRYVQMAIYIIPTLLRKKDFSLLKQGNNSCQIRPAPYMLYLKLFCVSIDQYAVFASCKMYSASALFLRSDD